MPEKPIMYPPMMSASSGAIRSARLGRSFRRRTALSSEHHTRVKDTSRSRHWAFHLASAEKVQQLVECGQVGITGNRGQGGRGCIGHSQDGLYPDNRTLRSRIHACTLDPARIPVESLDRTCLGRQARAG